MVPPLFPSRSIGLSQEKHASESRADVSVGEHSSFRSTQIQSSQTPWIQKKTLHPRKSQVANPRRDAECLPVSWARCSSVWADTGNNPDEPSSQTNSLSYKIRRINTFFTYLIVWESNEMSATKVAWKIIKYTTNCLQFPTELTQTMQISLCCLACMSRQPTVFLPER